MKFLIPSVITFSMNALAFAQGTQAAGGAAGGQGGAPSPSQGLPGMILVIGMIMALFYFLILRPQKTEQRKHEELLNSIAKGDSVITSAGIYGTVDSVDTGKGTITVAVAPKVSITFMRSAITQVTKKKNSKEKDSESEAGTEKA